MLLSVGLDVYIGCRLDLLSAGQTTKYSSCDLMHETESEREIPTSAISGRP